MSKKVCIPVDQDLYKQLKAICKREKKEIGLICGLLLNKGILEELNRRLETGLNESKGIEAIDI
jgi:hypothetical protein